MERRHIHGTYPFDQHGAWRTIRKLRVDEVVELIGIKPEERKNEPCYCEGTGKNDEYFWLNKGFIVLGFEAPLAGDELSCAMIELFDTPRVKGIKPGMQAVYLHDGKYSLIECIK